RAVLDLADRCGGVSDHRHSDALFRDLPTLREIGTMTTTLSEVRNRADLLLIVGPDPRLALPRFFDRCLGAGELLFGERKRRVIRLGPAATVALPGGGVTEIPRPPDGLPAPAPPVRAPAHRRHPRTPPPPGRAALPAAP